jgi:xanthine dehydrogenase iron-sulfur cluster and FAD-binding subunit A
VRDNGLGCSCDHARTTVLTEIGTSNIGKAYEERGTIMIRLKINGQEQSWDGDPDLPLLWFLRDEAGLTGTKFGCGQALCGACTVIVDKEAIRSCITSINDIAGREVTTI